ncbi:MAG: Lrp/AsnC family transcriptional regulator [Oscillospiraceae bacterium]|nr:Lrp/AsnC family transcriptional regulator [Oscillospiraceae bacterium]
MDQLLKLLEQNAKLTTEQLSALLGKSEEEIAAAVSELEKEHVILGYNALVNWEKIDPNDCTAVIELKVQPKRDHGYDEIAAEIMAFDEVQTVWLMSSSSYDLSVIIRGHSFREISMFVSKRLATLDSVTSTATNFVLKRYKEHFFTFTDEVRDERRHLNID